MSLFDLFGTKPSAPATAPAPAPVQTPMEQGATGAIESTGATGPTDPLAGLWDVKVTEANLGDNINLALTPEQLSPVLDKLDFSSVITPELRAAVSSGGDAAVNAMLTINNLTAKAAFAQAIIGNATLTQKAIEAANKNVDAKIQEALRKQGINNKVNSFANLPSDSPAKHMVDAVTQQIAAKYPRATADEVASMTQKYFQQELGQVFNLVPKQDSPNDDTANAVDWLKYANMG